MTIFNRLGVAIAVLFSVQAQAYDSRFEVDATQDLSALARTGELVLKVTRNDKKVAIDGSAVVKVDLEKYNQVTADFEKYVEHGVPDIKEMRVVARGPGDLVYVWQNLAASGRESKQYVEFHMQPALSNVNARGSEWEMVAHRAPWPYEEKSAFKSIEGSWYLEPQQDGYVYIRYFQSAEIGANLPGWLIELVIRNTLVKDSKLAFEAFLRVARAP